MIQRKIYFSFFYFTVALTLITRSGNFSTTQKKKTLTAAFSGLSPLGALVPKS